MMIEKTGYVQLNNFKKTGFREMKSNQVKFICLMGICFLLGFLTTITACSSIIKKPSVPASGFLKDYSNLKEGKGDEALMVYVDRGVNFHIYDKVMLDPVSIIFSDDSNLAKVSAGDRQKMADYFYAVLEENLSNRYIIASKPGSLTMRLRFALTDIKESQDLMNAVSTVHPIDSSIDLIAHTATGTHTYVGDAKAEMEIVDSMTGRRLAAAVDRRSSTWNDVKGACDYWAQRISQRLYEFTAGNYLPAGD
jgi:Protein of unknown function (DUF3313)